MQLRAWTRVEEEIRRVEAGEDFSLLNNESGWSIAGMFPHWPFVREIWNGERFLAETFWFWNVLICGLAFGALGLPIVVTLSRTMGTTLPVLMFILVVILESDMSYPELEMF